MDKDNRRCPDQVPHQTQRDLPPSPRLLLISSLPFYSLSSSSIHDAGVQPVSKMRLWCALHLHAPAQLTSAYTSYIPPDFDPKQHRTLNNYQGKKHALGNRAKDIDKGILVVRFELPFNIWCGGCNVRSCRRHADTRTTSAQVFVTMPKRRK